MNDKNYQKRPKRKKSKKLIWIILLELVVVLALFGAYQLFVQKDKKPNNEGSSNTQGDIPGTKDGVVPDEEVDEVEVLTPEEIEAANEQERLKKAEQDRKDLIVKADKLILNYDYDKAVELIKGFESPEGGYEAYPVLVAAIARYEAQKSALVLYGGSYTSVTQFSHIFFHSLVADNSKAFDGDEDENGYNMYMTTATEFVNMMQEMYEDGYILVSIHDIAKQETLEDGSTVFAEQEIYLPEGKKPFVLSQDDVNYYDYMTGDGFASRMVVGEDGKPTTEMILEDGSVVTGPYDMVPILDAFIEEHPDFSYKGAKGILALTGYEGTLGYRTNDPESPTYEEDKETVKKVVEALKKDGWELASHSWGHRNMQEKSYEFIKTDTNRWFEEVGSLIGPTDIIIFPYGVDIETTMGLYSGDKYKFLKEKGFNYFCGVDSKPWMHIKNDYVRMTRRPLDGQAMLQFPERLTTDLFSYLNTIIDPDRPERGW